LDELLLACKQVYKRGGYFIYGYLVVTMEIMKWCTPKGHVLTDILDGEAIALSFDPWKAHSNSTNISFNEKYFKDLV